MNLWDVHLFFFSFYRGKSVTTKNTSQFCKNITRSIPMPLDIKVSIVGHTFTVLFHIIELAFERQLHLLITFFDSKYRIAEQTYFDLSVHIYIVFILTLL